MSKVAEVMRAWLRARDKRRHGLWITHSSAKAAIQDLIDELDTAGFVLVPKSAIDWLDGAAPDPEGKWFGDDVPAGRPYWWRAKSRAMIEASRVTP